MKHKGIYDALYALSQLKENGFKVAMFGLGPDECLAGYHYYKEPYGVKTWKKAHELFDPILDHFVDEEGDLIQQMNYMDITHYLPDHLQRGDAALMAHTIEGRYPYLDHRIVEKMFSYPPEWKIDKRALRLICSLPEYYLNAPKQGLSVDMPHIVKHELHEWIEDNIASLGAKLIPTNYKQRFFLACLNRFRELFSI